ncbi:MAG: hypothetical protein JRF72_23585 [Deltaproteobacteria bacterium]|nr:hypothetical protein [Deltaproteobacteria bacterium]
MALTRDFNLLRPRDDEKPLVSIGDYFLAVRLFFETSGIEYVANALKRWFEQPINPEDIEHIDIFLVKHGEFYHPARIEVSIHEKRIYFVLNVAISPAGKAHIEGEYQCLKKLNKDYSFDYLPRVYGRHEVEISNHSRVPMFLGDWLNHYHEFHISRDRGNGLNRIRVWDSGRKPYFLTASQSLDLYTQAAGILTGYYSLESFEQICAWHHAAGDFVVRVENEKLDLKLITVRRYAPIFEKSFLDDSKNLQDSAEFILQALLLFFLNLSLKMRLDRFDGVGDIVWAEDAAVQGTLIGFLNALALKANISALPDTPLRCFFQYLSLCSRTDLRELSESLLNRFNPDSPEIDVIKQHLNNHIDTMLEGIHNL